MTRSEKDIIKRGLAYAIMVDARFFTRRPNRHHRIRLAYPEEIAFARHGGIIKQPIPPGIRVYVGIRVWPTPGKVIGYNGEEAETDLSEQDALEAYRTLASHSDETLKNFVAQHRAAPSSSETRGPIE